jgi:hypothetical protein
VKVAYFRESDHAQTATSNILTLAVAAPTTPGTPGTPGTPETPTEPATPVKPTAPVGPLTDAQLAAADRGDVHAPDRAVTPGSMFDVELGAARANTWNQVWLQSDPLDLGWALADADGRISVALPADAPAGEHRLVVLAEDGSLVGWDDLTVLAAAGGVDPDGTVPVSAGGAVLDPATGELAYTGAEFAPAAIAALLLLAAGGSVMVLRRRRTDGDETV